jgi:hypothetical protein
MRDLWNTRHGRVNKAVGLKIVGASRTLSTLPSQKSCIIIHILVPSMDTIGKLPEHYITVLGDYGVGKQSIRRRVHILASTDFRHALTRASVCRQPVVGDL